LTPYASLLAEPDIKESYSVSLRRAFVASEGCLIIAADYSQLELRILAHMSEDKLLCKLLGMANQDVLKAVASSWKKKSISKVTKEERQQAKQICYGILYGIGVKSLSEQLGVTEEEAFAFTKSFMATYPGVKKFIDFTVSECRKNGYTGYIVKNPSKTRCQFKNGLEEKSPILAPPSPSYPHQPILAPSKIAPSSKHKDVLSKN
jgi:DNA polymerase I-like protein with 3'-5' exonuclease and polymerase domains